MSRCDKLTFFYYFRFRPTAFRRQTSRQLAQLQGNEEAPIFEDLQPSYRFLGPNWIVGELQLRHLASILEYLAQMRLSIATPVVKLVLYE